MKGLALLCFVLASAASSAQTTGSIGLGGGCAELGRTVQNHWFDVKSLMAGEGASTRRPRSRDFNCISPYYVQNAIPKNVPGVQGRLSCYSLQGGVGVCCDTQLKECVSL